jgi:hypothetical protein
MTKDHRLFSPTLATECKGIQAFFFVLGRVHLRVSGSLSRVLALQRGKDTTAAANELMEPERK